MRQQILLAMREFCRFQLPLRKVLKGINFCFFPPTKIGAGSESQVHASTFGP